MSKPVNQTEAYVEELCRRSFLSLWSYANPRGKDASKELCDILVVCDPDIIIFSVKAVDVPDTGRPSTDLLRWRRRAIEASVKQIYGAQRWIDMSREVTRRDGTPGLLYPKLEKRRVHRIAVAFGSKGKAPVQFGDFGKGFVHVFDEISLSVIMSELDTITDFVSYLSAKEALYESGIRTEFYGAEEDLLAFYLHRGRTFPEDVDTIAVVDGVWSQFSSKDEYRAKKLADYDSYIWDRIIETVGEDVLSGDLEFGSSLNDSEMALRTMALETRFSRRLLGRAFNDFVEMSKRKKVRSRMLESPSGVIYVFLATPHGTDRQYRVAELGNRCIVARGLNRDRSTVVGLATEEYELGRGFSFDVMYIHRPEWTVEDQKKMERMKEELSYFTQPIEFSFHEDEYPL